MKESWSYQYQSPCVRVIYAPGLDAESIIEFANAIGARVHAVDAGPEEPDDYVIHFESSIRDVGPELYTEEALRRSCARSIEVREREIVVHERH